MWYLYTMEYYSAMKRSEIGSFVEMWMVLESVIQSEVSQCICYTERRGWEEEASWYSVKSMDPGVKQAWLQVLVLPFTCWTLDKLLTLSDPQPLYLNLGIML